MAIHAQKTAFRSSAMFPDFKVTGPLTAGQLLSYSDTDKAFINKDAASITTGGGGGGGGGDITGAVNLGTGSEWFKGVNVSDELEFRTILPGQGISIVEGADEIEVTNTIISTASISVPDSFTIEIDNDDTTLDTALFELLTNSNPASVVFTPISNTFAALDIITVTDPGGSDPGKFISTAGLAIETGLVSATYTNSETIVINTVTVTLSTGTTVDDAVIDITAAAISGITAANVGGALELTATNVDLTLAEGSGTALVDLGFTPGTTSQVFTNFVTLGFAVGMCISVAGTTEQDGIFKIASINTTTNTNDTITITIHFPDDTDGGAQPSTTIDGMFFEFTAANTLVMFGRDLVLDGFIVGQTIDIIGSTDNDGSFTLATVAGDTLTITGTFPGTIDCDVGAITVEVPIAIHSTGWSVNELGEMAANATTICGDIDVICDGDINIDTGTLNLGGVDIITLINGASLVVAGNGIITQTSTGVFEPRSIAVTTGLSIVDGDGVAGNPTISVDAFDITLTGEVTGTGTVTDLTNVNIITTLEDNGAVAGSFNKVTVDTTGRVTSGLNQPITVTTGLSIINADGVAGNPVISVDDFDLTFTGDATGSGTVTDLTNTAIVLTLSDIGVAGGPFNSVNIDAKGRVVSAALIPGGSFQPADPALDDLSGGLVSPGVVVWDGVNYIDRLIDGTTNEIDITDADGVAGNMTIGIADDPILPGIGAVTIPIGFIGDRPGAPTEGMMRLLQSAPNVFEGYVDGSWQSFLMGSTSGFLLLTGGTMTGDVVMDDNNITFTTGLVDGRDVSADGLVLDAINTGTGIKVQTAPDTFVNRTIVGTVPIVVTDSDGVSGNPTVEFDMTLVTDLEIGQVIDEVNDKVLIYDDSQAALRTISAQRLMHHPARRYFMAQF